MSRRNNSKSHQTVLERIRAINERSRDILAGTQAGFNYGYELTGTYHGADRKRMLYDQAGYPDTVEPGMLFNMYRRFGIARAIVNLKPNKTWQKPPVIYEGDVDPERRERNPTAFEKQWDKYSAKWKVWERLLGADKRQRVMRYSGLLIICREPSKRRPREALSRLVGPEAIIKFKPVFETEIVINEAYQDITDPRYGLPKYYQFRARTPGSRNPWENEQYTLHPSRVIPFAEDADDDSPYGISALEAAYNALLDMEKVRMAGAEGLYKKAKQRTVINLKDEAGAAPTTNETDGMNDAIDEFERNFNDMLLLQNAEATTLDTTIADPKSAWYLGLHEIAALEETPSTILIGQQTGRLASDEDNSYFNNTIKTRRQNWGESMIFTFIDRMTEIGALDEHEELTVEWDNISDPTQNEKLDSATKMTSINKSDFDAGGPGDVFTEEEIRGVAGYEPKKETGTDSDRGEMEGGEEEQEEEQLEDEAEET